MIGRRYEEVEQDAGQLSYRVTDDGHGSVVLECPQLAAAAAARAAAGERAEEGEEGEDEDGEDEAACLGDTEGECPAMLWAAAPVPQ